MTEAQRKYFYFPTWLKVAAKLDWVMQGGRLLADLEAQYEAASTFSTVARDLVRQVIGQALAMARQEARAATADDLRHACNRIASGGKCESATKLNNAQLNEFVRICGVLANPIEDLASVIPYLNPEEDDRQRALRHLRKLSYGAQLAAIAENNFGTRDWEGLGLIDLNRLRMLVRGGGRSVRKATAVNPF